MIEVHHEPVAGALRRRPGDPAGRARPAHAAAPGPAPAHRPPPGGGPARCPHKAAMVAVPAPARALVRARRGSTPRPSSPASGASASPSGRAASGARSRSTVMGTLDAAGPDRSAVLVRLADDRLAGTGVVAGMSGSPVYVDGKLLGRRRLRLDVGAGAARRGDAVRRHAARSRWPEKPCAPPPRRWPNSPRWRAGAVELARGAARAARPARPGRTAAARGRRAARAARASPASCSRRRGSQPVPAGTVAGLTGPPEAGDMVAVVLVWGDASLAAGGTVTARDGDRVWAFGHPLYGLGAVRFPGRPRARPGDPGLVPEPVQGVRRRGPVRDARRRPPRPGSLARGRASRPRARRSRSGSATPRGETYVALLDRRDADPGAAARHLPRQRLPDRARRRGRRVVGAPRRCRCTSPTAARSRCGRRRAAGRAGAPVRLRRRGRELPRELAVPAPRRQRAWISSSTREEQPNGADHRRGDPRAHHRLSRGGARRRRPPGAVSRRRSSTGVS